MTTFNTPLVPSPFDTVRGALEKMATLKLYYGATSDVVKQAKTALAALDELGAERERLHMHTDGNPAELHARAAMKTSQKYMKERYEALDCWKEAFLQAALFASDICSAIGFTDEAEPGAIVHACKMLLAERDAIRLEESRLRAVVDDWYSSARARGLAPSAYAGSDPFYPKGEILGRGETTALREARDRYKAERDKFRGAASVLCGAHIGQSQPACPVCMVDRYREEIEEWEREVFRACAGHIGTPERPTSDPVRPNILRDLREHIDSVRKERDEARATVANLQKMLAAVRATGVLSPGDDWLTAIPEALAELDKLRADPPADLSGTLAGIELALRECVEDSSPYAQVDEEKLEAWKRAIVAHGSGPALSEEEDYTSDELKENPPEYWVCKIGPTTRGHLLDGADSPMRQAIGAAFLSVAGHEPGVCFSGWGNKLLKTEQEALGYDVPDVPRLAAPLGEWQIEAMERALECVEKAGNDSLASSLSRIIAGQRRRAK